VRFCTWKKRTLQFPSSCEHSAFLQPRADFQAKLLLMIQV
jgi:hypothetical protein